MSLSLNSRNPGRMTVSAECFIKSKTACVSIATKSARYPARASNRPLSMQCASGFFRRPARRIAQGTKFGSGSQNAPRRGRQNRAACLPKYFRELGRAGALRAYTRGEERAAHLRQVEAQTPRRIADRGAHHEPGGSEFGGGMRRKFARIKRPGLAGNIARDGACLGARMLEGGTLRIGGQREHEYPAPRFGGEVERGSKRPETQIRREGHGVGGQRGTITQVGGGVSGHGRADIAPFGIQHAPRPGVPAARNDLFEGGNAARTESLE